MVARHESRRSWRRKGGEAGCLIGGGPNRRRPSDLPSSTYLLAQIEGTEGGVQKLMTPAGTERMLRRHVGGGEAQEICTGVVQCP